MWVVLDFCVNVFTQHLTLPPCTYRDGKGSHRERGRRQRFFSSVPWVGKLAARRRKSADAPRQTSAAHEQHSGTSPGRTPLTPLPVSSAARTAGGHSAARHGYGTLVHTPLALSKALRRHSVSPSSGARPAAQQPASPCGHGDTRRAVQRGPPVVMARSASSPPSPFLHADIDWAEVQLVHSATPPPPPHLDSENTPPPLLKQPSASSPLVCSPVKLGSGRRTAAKPERTPLQADRRSTGGSVKRQLALPEDDVATAYMSRERHAMRSPVARVGDPGGQHSCAAAEMELSKAQLSAERAEAPSPDMRVQHDLMEGLHVESSYAFSISVMSDSRSDSCLDLLAALDLDPSTPEASGGAAVPTVAAAGQSSPRGGGERPLPSAIPERASERGACECSATAAGVQDATPHASHLGSATVGSASFRLDETTRSVTASQHASPSSDGIAWAAVGGGTAATPAACGSTSAAAAPSVVDEASHDSLSPATLGLLHALRGIAERSKLPGAR